MVAQVLAGGKSPRRPSAGAPLRSSLRTGGGAIAIRAAGRRTVFQRLGKDSGKRALTRVALAVGMALIERNNTPVVACIEGEELDTLSPSARPDRRADQREVAGTIDSKL